MADIKLTKSFLKSKAKKLLSKFNLEKIDENQFGETGGREIRKLQVKSVYSLTSAMMWGNIFFATLLTINLLGKSQWLNILAISWCIVLVCISLFTLNKSKARAKAKKRIFRFRKIHTQSYSLFCNIIHPVVLPDYFLLRHYR